MLSLTAEPRQEETGSALAKAGGDPAGLVGGVAEGNEGRAKLGEPPEVTPQATSLLGHPGDGAHDQDGADEGQAGWGNPHVAHQLNSSGVTKETRRSSQPSCWMA